MELHIKIIGYILLVLSASHLIFPSYFNWKKELKKLSLINAQMMTIHTFFIALIILLMGILCITSSGELLSTTLGKSILLGMGIFWCFRLLVQFFGYSSTLWKGKTFETSIHILFIFLWSYLSFIFLYTAII